MRSIRNTFFIILVFSLAFSSFSDQITEKEQIVYISNDGNKLMKITENVSFVEVDGITLHKIDLESSDGGTAQIYLHKGDLQPYHLVYFDSKGQKTQEIKYRSDNKIEVFIRDKNIRYVYQKHHKELWDMNSFFHLFRGYPLKEEEIKFFCFVPDMKRSTLLYIKKKKEEELVIDGKKIVAIKLELGAANFIESLIVPQVFNFWISKNEPHVFLRFRGKDMSGKQQKTDVLFNSLLR